MRKRVLQYLIPVVLISVACNVTKFFELKVHYPDEIGNTNAANRDFGATENSTTAGSGFQEIGNYTRDTADRGLYVDVTDLRMEPKYMIFITMFRYKKK